MAKAAKKKRPDKYEPKLKVSGSFADLIGVSVGKKTAQKDENT
jgi:hypothetical protein